MSVYLSFTDFHCRGATALTKRDSRPDARPTANALERVADIWYCGSRLRSRKAARDYLLFSQRSYVILLLETQTRSWRDPAVKEKADVLQGTLALMVLKTLDVLGPLHGYGIARRIEQISGDLLAVN